MSKRINYRVRFMDPGMADEPIYGDLHDAIDRAQIRSRRMPEDIIIVCRATGPYPENVEPLYAGTGREWRLDLYDVPHSLPYAAAYPYPRYRAELPDDSDEIGPGPVRRTFAEAKADAVHLAAKCRDRHEAANSVNNALWTGIEVYRIEEPGTVELLTHRHAAEWLEIELPPLAD